MNATGDWNFCLGLQPTWAPADHDCSVDHLLLSSTQAQSYCPLLETYVKQTVPCPPPTKPCLFWAAANNTTLSSWDVQLVARACGVPSISLCSNVHSVNPSTTEEHSCTPLCIGLVVCFLLLVLFVAYCAVKCRKRSLSELCSTGVCICIDRVVIRKTGLNRTESCSPALTESKPDIRGRGSVNNGYVNSDIFLDWQKDRVEYFYNSEENDPDVKDPDVKDPDKEDPDSGIVPNAELKPDDSSEEGISVYNGQSPAPDVVTMASHTQNRLSYC